MSSTISLVTFAGQTVTPQDDALVYESALGDGGIIYGGEVTLKDANTLHIAAGHGVIAGRKFTIFASDIAIPLSASGTLLGRLYIHMDLSNASDPIDILYETGNSLTPPVQDDNVNIVMGVFEFNLATFTVSTSTIADLSNIYPQIQYANSGSFIYVDAISPELIGAQVEVTDGVDTITAIFDANGRAELKNVFMTGTLQISASSGIYSAGTTLNVPYFGTYNVSLALWMATLNISTSSSVLFGQQITITDSSSAVVGTTTFSNVGTATFIVGAPDTYTLSVTYGGNTYTKTVNVSAETTYSVSLNAVPDGSTVLPTDDVQIWLACANITDKAYTTISEVLNDSTTLLALISDNNAVDYMVRSTTWASDVCADSTAMTDIGANNYCANKLLANSTWRTAICNSTYFESVLNVKVPTMTSATAPSGTVTQSTYQSGYDGYYAFNSTTSTPWLAQDNKGSVDDWVAYEFTSAVYVSKVTIQGSTSRPMTVHVEAYLDGSWESISSDTSISDDNTHTIICNSVETSTKFRLYCVAQSASLCAFVRYLQFYGRTTS